LVSEEIPEIEVIYKRQGSGDAIERSDE